jgi:hypothetical protein
MALVAALLIAGAVLVFLVSLLREGPQETAPSPIAGQSPTPTTQAGLAERQRDGFALSYSASPPEIERGLTSADVSMEVTAAVTNQAEAEARNVRLVVQAMTEGTVLPINGEPELQVPLGTLRSGEPARPSSPSGSI